MALTTGIRMQRQVFKTKSHKHLEKDWRRLWVLTFKIIVPGNPIQQPPRLKALRHTRAGVQQSI